MKQAVCGKVKFSNCFILSGLNKLRFTETAISKVYGGFFCAQLLKFAIALLAFTKKKQAFACF